MDNPNTDSMMLYTTHKSLMRTCIAWIVLVTMAGYSFQEDEFRTIWTLATAELFKKDINICIERRPS